MLMGRIQPRLIQRHPVVELTGMVSSHLEKEVIATSPFIRAKLSAFAFGHDLASKAA